MHALEKEGKVQLFLPGLKFFPPSKAGLKFFPPSKAESRGATGLHHSIHHVTPAWEEGTQPFLFFSVETIQFREREKYGLQNHGNKYDDTSLVYFPLLSN